MAKKITVMTTPIIIGEDIIQMIRTNSDRVYCIRSVRDYSNRYHNYWTRVYKVDDNGHESDKPTYIDFYDKHEDMIAGHSRAVEYMKNKY